MTLTDWQISVHAADSNLDIINSHQPMDLLTCSSARSRPTPLKRCRSTSLEGGLDGPVPLHDFIQEMKRSRSTSWHQSELWTGHWKRVDTRVGGRPSCTTSFQQEWCWSFVLQYPNQLANFRHQEKSKTYKFFHKRKKHSVAYTVHNFFYIFRRDIAGWFIRVSRGKKEIMCTRCSE
jgi:hypothetical protein